MIFRTNILLKTYKRNINTKVLREALFDMNISSTSNKSENIKEDLCKLETLEVKAESIVNHNIIHEDILTNIYESEKILENLREDLDLVKKTQLNLNIKVEEVAVSNEKKILINLNEKVGFFNEERAFGKNILNDNENFIDTINERSHSINNINKSLWDLPWLQPFFDFIHNHSTLVFTVGGGMLLGGVLFLSNFGYINIGSLLTRIGINLFSSNTATVPQPINSSPININIQNPNSENNVREISSGFFRQLGKKLLEVIDLYIEKLKDGRAKYK